MQSIAYRLWAKSEPHHYLWRHLLDVAAVVRALWPRFGRIEDIPWQWVCYLCALHDIGKADDWFQNKVAELADKLAELGLKMPVPRDTSSADELHFRHEARSRRWIQAHLSRQHKWDVEAAIVVAQAINGHHGNFGAGCYNESEPRQAVWQPLRDELASMVWDALQPPDYEPRDFEHAGAVGVALSGLIILADWIASNNDIYDYTTLQGHETPREYFAAAQRLAQAVVREMKLNTPPAGSNEPPPFGKMWPAIALTPRPLQSSLERLVLANTVAPGLAIIEEQMGQGKTEAAIYLAEWWNVLRGTRGMYIGLPTQATSNQMFLRYRKHLAHWRPGDESRLVHGMAWMFDERSPEQGAQTYGENAWEERLLSREWFRPLRRALLSSDGVGTVDQALLAALHVKFGVLRLVGLRSKVLVIDECHAYDEYMTTILEQLLKWCRTLQVPVILLSATLSARQKRKLIEAYGGDASTLALNEEDAYPLMTLCSLEGRTHAEIIEPKVTQQNKLRLQLHHGVLDDVEAIARLALERIADGGCNCVLMNTVKGAQEVYRAIDNLLENKEFAPPDVQCLFHARFRAEARLEIEKKVTAWFGKEAKVEDGTRPRRAVLVATQVVEQSLDVDFDFFLTQIAPIDLLLQRSGRLWRHLRDKRFAQFPIFEVLLPPAGELQFGVSEVVYAREILLRSLVALNLHQIVELPRHFRPLIETVYGETLPESEIVPPHEIEEAAQQWKKSQDEARSAANVNLLPDPDPAEFGWVGRDKGEAEEGAAKTYLRASTRLGNESRAALVLEDKELTALGQSSQTDTTKSPSRKKMQQLFAHKVNLPAWWLREKEPAEGYETIFEGANWLRGNVIVPTRNGEWHAASGAILRDDARLGLTFTPVAKVDLEKGEADAGITG